MNVVTVSLGFVLAYIYVYIAIDLHVYLVSIGLHIYIYTTCCYIYAIILFLKGHCVGLVYLTAHSDEISLGGFGIMC